MIIKVDNLIIGAGPSGLTAAYSILKNKDLGNVEIIESSEKYLGGISRTESKGDYRFDNHSLLISILLFINFYTTFCILIIFNLNFNSFLKTSW